MHRKNVRIQTVFLAIILTIACRIQAYEYAKLVPAADIRLTISDIAGITNAVKETPIGRCWQDPEMQAFLGNPDISESLGALMRGTNAVNEQKTRLEAEQWRMLKGAFVMAINLPETGAKAFPAIYLAARLSEEDYRKSQELDRQIAELDEQKTKISREIFQDQELVMIVQADRDGQEIKTWQTWLHDTLIVSSSKEWVEQTVARIKREGPPAAPKNATPKIDLSISGEMIRTKFFQSFIDDFNKKRKEMARLQNAPAAPQADAGAILKALGLDTLQTIQISMQFETRQSGLAFTIDRGAARRGIWKLLDEQSLPGDVIKLPYVPANLTGFSVSRLDLPALWKELPGMLQAIDPTAGGMLAMMTGMAPQMFGFDLEADVMGNIGNTIAAMTLGDSKQLFAWQIKDPAAADNVLRQIASKNQDVGGEFRGTPVCHFKNPTNPNEGIAMATAGKYLYIGELDQVQSAIRAQLAEKPVDPAFFQSTLYREMLRHKPQGAVHASLSDFQAVIKEWLSDSNTAKLKKTVKCPGIKKNQPFGNLLGGIDFSKIPASEKIASFFDAAYGYTTVSGDRIEYKQIIIHPAK